MQIDTTPLPGVMLLTPKRIGDARGFFSEVWNSRTLAENGIEIPFVQDNQSLSMEAGTVRGLHFQMPPHAQAKLVRCGRGRLFDVAVDIRRGSPTFGHWTGAELSFENGRQLLIPVGFAHGFMTLERETEIIYKCSDHYAPEAEGTVLWNDPEIGIDWPETAGRPILSDKDRAAPRISEIDIPFVFGAAA